MPATIRIVTDGAADLPAELAHRLGITTVTGPVRVGNQRWSGDAEEFWRAVRGNGRAPSTAPPSTDQLAAAYGQNGPVLAVHVSAELSRTFERAQQAAKQQGSQVVVQDSRSLSVGTGLVTLDAAQAVNAGVDLDRLRELVESWIEQLHLHAVIDDAGPLVRGGRAGLVAARVTKHAPRHLVAVRGHAIPISRHRQRHEALRALLEHVREHVPDGARSWAVGHGDAPDIGQVVEQLRSLFGSDPAYVTLFGPPVGSHLGPGAFAVAFLSAR